MYDVTVALEAGVSVFDDNVYLDAIKAFDSFIDSFHEVYKK